MIRALIFCLVGLLSAAQIEGATNFCTNLTNATFPVNASLKLDQRTQAPLRCKTYENYAVLSAICLVVPVYDCSKNNSDGSPELLAKKFRYLLWTRSNSMDNAYFVFDDKTKNNLLSSPFNTKLRTYFLIHGFQSNGKTEWVLNSKTNYLNVSDCNVISIDWKNIADNPNYAVAATGVYTVASVTAKVIDWMISNTKLPAKNIHITGHSLGAQMAGMVGKSVKQGRIDRITGLDPAGPLFYSKPTNKRIYKTDADFVDIIHTNGGSILKGCYGLLNPVGNADFYPNGGEHQPGCLIPNTSLLIDIATVCSHSRAHEYWVESILAGQDSSHSNEFWAWDCLTNETMTNQSCPVTAQKVVMGYHVNVSTTNGTYYLSTNSTSPFALGLPK